MANTNADHLRRYFLSARCMDLERENAELIDALRVAYHALHSLDEMEQIDAAVAIGTLIERYDPPPTPPPNPQRKG